MISWNKTCIFISLNSVKMDCNPHFTCHGTCSALALVAQPYFFITFFFKFSSSFVLSIIFGQHHLLAEALKLASTHLTLSESPMSTFYSFCFFPQHSYLSLLHLLLLACFSLEFSGLPLLFVASGRLEYQESELLI